MIYIFFILQVVYDPVKDEAAALIGVNNPFLIEFPKTICHDICDQLSWIDFDTHDLSAGPVYCCTVQELREHIPNVPDLPSAALLTG